ncbi:hypothetical protein M2138_001644 [Dysgonomonadaceae bacterium PH5-43]|nr:hypothetical protein [Dysgonomonadaceae bacterium PH5-43]
METVVLTGGLGNQMFQYVFYLAKKKRGNACFNSYFVEKEGAHSGYDLYNAFGIEGNNKTPFILKLIRKLIIFEKKKPYKTIASCSLSLLRKLGVNYIVERNHSEYNEDYLIPQKEALYFGYWQTPKYFNDINKLRDIFCFSNINEKNISFVNSIKDKESVAIHIRCGDYLSEDNKNTYGGICTKEYYDKAISLMNADLENVFYVVFSDEPEKAKQILSVDNAVYVDWNTKDRSFEDMYLMSKCKHNIIANSTFSWWGAQLNSNPNKKVIAPKKFLNNYDTPDIYPLDWITI